MYAAHKYIYIYIYICIYTSTGAARMWPIAHHTRWPPGTARRGLRCCVKKVGSASHGVASGEHPGPGGDPGAALNATPRYQPRGIGADTPAAPLLRNLSVAPSDSTA